VTKRADEAIVGVGEGRWKCAERIDGLVCCSATCLVCVKKERNDEEGERGKGEKSSGKAVEEVGKRERERERERKQPKTEGAGDPNSERGE
jgi:hypothetical protein